MRLELDGVGSSVWCVDEWQAAGSRRGKKLLLSGQRWEMRDSLRGALQCFCNAPAHYNYARDEGIRVYSNLEVREKGIDSVTDEAIARAAKGVDALYVSLDIDSLDHTGCSAHHPA